MICLTRPIHCTMISVSNGHLSIQCQHEKPEAKPGARVQCIQCILNVRFINCEPLVHALGTHFCAAWPLALNIFWMLRQNTVRWTSRVHSMVCTNRQIKSNQFSRLDPQKHPPHIKNTAKNAKQQKNRHMVAKLGKCNSHLWVVTSWPCGMLGPIPCTIADKTSTMMQVFSDLLAWIPINPDTFQCLLLPF